MEVTILGCGSSSGSPRADGYWGQCDPAEIKNQRLRSSIALKTHAQKTWLIDASPDLRQQCLNNDIRDISGVLCTHAHFDHIGGIEELRVFAGRSYKVLCYGDENTLLRLKTRAPYAFEVKTQGYPFFLQSAVINGPFMVDGIEVIPFKQDHGMGMTSLGFRFPTWAYSTDVHHLDEDAMTILKGVDTWIVDCFDLKPSPTHAHLSLVLRWAKQVQPRRLILTHLGRTIDYWTLQKKLPKNVYVAYDGMKLSC
jgi:phosphoribosyl 1,2-cyclic phosphate phosphodiesterase